MTSLMTREYYIKTFMPIIKKMKCDIYLVMNSFILGSNTDNSYLSIVYDLNNGVPNNNVFIEITSKSLVEINKYLEENENITNVYDLLFERSNIYGKLGRSNLYLAYQRLVGLLAGKSIPDFSISNMKEDDRFNEILKLKAADGAVPYHFGTSDTIYIYPGLLGINKSDRVSMNYFRFPNIGTDICEFLIDKKFIKIHKYIAYLPLN